MVYLKIEMMLRKLEYLESFHLAYQSLALEALFFAFINQ
jgi:hypothetical protein